MPGLRNPRVARGFAVDPEVGPTGAPGPTGPGGPAGPAGSSGGFYTHTQVGVSAVWAVTHNLGYRPAVSAFDSAGTQVEGEIVHTDDNNLTISFYQAGSPLAISGTADMS